MRYARMVAIALVVAVPSLYVAAEVAPLSSPPSYDLGPDGAVEVETKAKADTLVVYSASWCAPCQAMRPALLRLKRAGYKIVYLDIDKIERGEHKDKYKVRETKAVPELVFLREKKVVHRHSGYMSRALIAERMEKTLDPRPFAKLVDDVRDSLVPDRLRNR